MDLSEYLENFFVETFEGRPAFCPWFCAESPGSTCLQTMQKSIVFQTISILSKINPSITDTQRSENMTFTKFLISTNWKMKNLNLEKKNQPIGKY